MLYVLIEAQRDRLKKLQKDNELIKPESRIISKDKRGQGTEPSEISIIGQHVTKEPISSLLKPLIQGSEWFTLSPEEKLAWAKASKDPRIAADQHSPLEKKILNICLPDAFNLFLLNQRITRGLLDKTYL
uniref:uncharacterized protein LOC101956707 isoform X4 n=1 Tax=Ictidomys tridecemlineatus TaxID=43179 RepID=UPI001A9DF1C6|nr:uncharacterized protein LOC101956707 isoform X4 [Ictidomys tridecemlineatus]